MRNKLKLNRELYIIGTIYSFIVFSLWISLTLHDNKNAE